MAKDMTGCNLTKGTLRSLRFISLQPQLLRREPWPCSEKEADKTICRDGQLMRQSTDGAEHRQLLPGRRPVPRKDIGRLLILPPAAPGNHMAEA